MYLCFRYALFMPDDGPREGPKNVALLIQPVKTSCSLKIVN